MQNVIEVVLFVGLQFRIDRASGDMSANEIIIDNSPGKLMLTHQLTRTDGITVTHQDSGTVQFD